MKTLTREQLEQRKAKAVRFPRNLREDDELANEIEDESLEECVEHRRIEILNPKGVTVPTKRELLDKIEELESENEDLQYKLDEIADLVAPEEDETEEDEDEGE